MRSTASDSPWSTRALATGTVLLLGLASCAGGSVDETLIPESATTTSRPEISRAVTSSPNDGSTSSTTPPATGEPEPSGTGLESVIHVLGTFEMLPDDGRELLRSSDLLELDVATLATIGCVEGPPPCEGPRVESLASGGIDVVNLATASGDDGGSEPLAVLESSLLAQGVDVVGFGRSVADAVAPVIVGTDQVSIAVHAISIVDDTGPSAHADDTTAGIAGPDSTEFLIDSMVESQLDGHEVVVLVNWGTADGRAPESAQLDFVRRLIDTGARAIIGNGPRLQRFELIEEVAVFHSLGPAASERTDPLVLDTAIARLSFTDSDQSCILPSTASPLGPTLDDLAVRGCG